MIKYLLSCVLYLAIMLSGSLAFSAVGTPSQLYPWVDTINYSSFSSAVSQAAAQGKGVVVSTSVATISSGMTVTVPVAVLKGGLLTTTATVTFSGPFDAGVYQVFSVSGSGKVAFGTTALVKEVYPEWWGIDGTADDVQINLAISAVKSAITSSWASVYATRAHGAAPIRLTGRDYGLSSGITLYGGMSLLGSGRETTVLTFTGSSTNIITIDKYDPGDTPILMAGVHLADFGIAAGGRTNVGIFTPNTSGMENAVIERISIDNAQVGVRIESGWLNTVRNVFVSNAIVGFAAMPTSVSLGVNQNYFVDCRADRFTRHGFFISGVSNKLLNPTAQFDAYTGTDSAPANIASHAFPVGIEIYGKDSVTLGVVPSNPVNNEILGGWLEAIADSSNGVGIYLDGVDTVFGYIGPITSTIDGVFVNNNVDKFLYVNAGSYTQVRRNFTKGSAYVILNPPNAVLTQFLDLGFIGYIQNPSGTDLSPAAGNYSMIWQTGAQGNKILLKGIIGFDTQAGFDNADTLLYSSSVGTAASTPRISNTYLSLSEDHGYATDVQSFSSSVTILSAATRTITGAIPAGCTLLGMTLLVTEEITGAGGFTGFDIGDGTTQNLWGDNISPVLGTAARATDYAATWTGPRFYLTGNNLILTARGGNFDGTTGKIRYVAHCITLGAPTMYN